MFVFYFHSVYTFRMSSTHVNVLTHTHTQTQNQLNMDIIMVQTEITKQRGENLPPKNHNKHTPNNESSSLWMSCCFFTMTDPFND